MNDWLTALWFFLPAGVANMSPVLANKVPLLNKWNAPLDFGMTVRGKRILGDNKTWRGIVFGVLMALAVNELQHIFFVWDATPAWYAAGLMGLGALLGDTLESFLKRQKHIASGESWFPFDQIDYILGGLLLVWPVAELTLTLALQIMVLYFGLHLLTAYIGYKIGLKDKPI